MKLAAWFWHAGSWHMEQAPRRGRCGVELVNDPAVRVEATEDEPVPPVPCRTCLVEAAMDDVVDEPLADAKARGFLPYTMDDEV